MPLSAPDGGSRLQLLFDLGPAAALGLLAAGLYFGGAWMLERSLAAEQQQQARLEQERSCVADLSLAQADDDFADFSRGLGSSAELPARLQQLAQRTAVDGLLPPLEVELSPPRRHGREALASRLELTAKFRHEGHFYAFVNRVDDWAAGAYWFDDCALQPVAGQDFSVLARCRLRLLSNPPRGALPAVAD